jgi:hypothetical protein
MNYIQLSQAIQNYAENTEALFVSSIPTFVMEAEDRIYNSVQIPSLRKNVTGTMTLGNQYVSLPNDWLANYSLAVINPTTGNYSYLLNKDVNFMREAYPNPTTTGTPRFYGLFGSQSNNFNELSLIITPTPDVAYGMELHYFYYPVSIVQSIIYSLDNTIAGSGYTNGTYYNVPLNGGSGSGATVTIVVTAGAVSSTTINNGGAFYAIGDVLTVTNTYIGGSGSGYNITVISVNNAAGTSWLGDNYDPVLFYGAMREAIIFMKGEQDMVTYYEKMFQEAIGELNRLSTGLERGDAYRDGQAKIKVSP